jgi:hypothetical protein
MPRQDGRIEQGQSLKSAISARAWNRAQDAADIVLGQRYGLKEGTGVAAGPGALVVPCHVFTTVEGVMPGHVVTFNGSATVRFPNLNKLEPDTFAPQVVALSGSVHTPGNFNPGFRTQYQSAFGVIVGGVTMPTPQNSQLVNVCVAGVCAARLRVRNYSTNLQNYAVEALGYFVQPAMLRRSTDTAQNLAGTLELSDSGIHRLLHVPSSPALISSDGNGEHPSDRTDVTWAVVLL